MCTALTLTTGRHYFGRTLDLEYSYNESVVVAPRNFPFSFRSLPPMERHHAMIGTAIVMEDFPLYYDATNEYGLSIAGLNFPGNAAYFPIDPAKANVAPFELIPWMLGQCATLAQALPLLNDLNLTNIPFDEHLPLAPLHWIVADKTGCVVLESTRDGLHIYDNPAGVLTNNPPFPFHMENLTRYMMLTNDAPENRFAPALDLQPCSCGMGAVGLPGDLSSMSRFVRVAFHRAHSHSENTENASVSQFFHLLGTVEMPEGSVLVGDKFDKTVYTSCCNTETGVYYYRTYSNWQINAVNMHSQDLSSACLAVHPFATELKIHTQS